MARLTGNERAIVVTALRHAAPYVRMYKGKTFVLKAGGEAFASDSATRSLIEQIAIFNQVGFRVVLVHGGGPQSSELAKQLGHEPQFVEGRRVTDEAALDIATMVLNGQINTRIVATCRAFGVPSIGVSGADGNLIRAVRRPPVELADGTCVDYGFVGDIDAVDVSVLETQLADGFVPIVSSLSADDDGTLLNINADTVAAAIASKLSAEKLILATGAPGIMESLDDPRSLISYIDRAGLARLREAGRLSEGMLPKVAAIENALAGGVPRVHVISYSVPDSLLLEVFTNEGTGTLVVDSIEELSPQEQGA
ncbi:MAG TPA: acetylglutamate kinase [Gammaproteobacteria bacterium]|nr:acetylglutamate kinase [Gammaproteobacteria bacterium]